ncbi:MAG: peptide-methionine (S)-S-oxide reductase MsrA [Methylophaga sp.]|nr:peptide-methionine (S)-S-oxide reductase MsrA [Methylophaga sp.]
MTIATFAAGCFWGIEAQFRQIEGVTATRVGYSNGTTVEPDYKQVCTGETGHAEVIEVTFDPDIVSFESLLGTFWKMHNPSTPNQQGLDIGTQYRSAVFYHDEQQREQAELVKKTLDNAHIFSGPIVTEITTADIFWPAEEYHQCYLEKKGLGSCH